MRFNDRNEAGRLLAKKLEKYRGKPCVVCALPRGGVVLGVEIADYLRAPLELIIPRKIGHPQYPEYAICAVTEDGHLVCNQEEVERIDPQWLKIAILKEQAEAQRRRERYLTDRKPINLTNKIVIITDDGVATGLTMTAAIQSVKDMQPKKIILAVPVIPKDIAQLLHKYVDEIVALEIPDHYLGSVGAYYKHFDQVGDESVIKLLAGQTRSRHHR